MIRTPRLDLVPASLEMLQSDPGDLARLGRLLGAEIPPGWPPELYDAPAIEWAIERLSADAENRDWYFHYFVRREESDRRVMIGAGGFKGPPVEGTVEVGYSILPEEQRKGYAAEATRGLVERAFAEPAVQRVIAHTLPDLEPSIGVLRKCGFELTGAGEEEGTIRYEITRAGAEEHVMKGSR